MSEIPGQGDKIVFFDVESLPAEPDNPLWIQLSKSLETDSLEDQKEFELRKERARMHTALMAPLGRPWMIGWALGNRDPVICRSDGKPGSEKALLVEFYEGVSEAVGDNTPWWVGHNIQNFDIPFLQVRALHHELSRLARLLSPLKAKTWEKRVLDTMKLWPRTSGDFSSYREHKLKGAGKLDTVCYLLGIEQQEGVMGPDVYQAWLSGDHEGVANHLWYDIEQVREVFKKLFNIL